MPLTGLRPSCPCAQSKLYAQQRSEAEPNLFQSTSESPMICAEPAHSGKQSEATPLHVRVDGVVRHHFR
jgi:hypothetical protein